MGTHSYGGQCPQCGNNKFDVSEDIHEIHTIDGFCDECGYKYWNKIGQADLEEVNEYRQDADKKPLTHLRKPRHSRGYMIRASYFADNNELDLAIADYTEVVLILTTHLFITIGLKSLWNYAALMKQ